MAFIPIQALFTAVHCRLSRTFFFAQLQPMDGVELSIEWRETSI
jgi:hypothetical protein